MILICYSVIFQSLFLDTNLYKLGSMGIKACPYGYEVIKDEETCEVASNALKIKHNKKANENSSDAVCFLCGKWCKPKSTRVSTGYRNGASWVCQKGMYLIPL